MEGSSSAEGQTTMSGVLPPKTSPAAYALGETGSTEELDIQSPEEPAERLELPERPLTEEQTEESADQTSARIRQLNDEIDRVYEQVLTEVGENESIATQCYNDLLRARDILLRRDVGQLAQAEYYIEQARARLKRAATSGAGARKNAWWIFAWGLFWGMILVAGLILLDSSYVQDTIALLDLKSPFVDPRVLLPAMLWGALGGVVAIWYSLFKHIAERDFDSHYNISYVGKPLFGLILGATVYMIANLLIVSLGIWPGSSTESATPAIAPWIIYLVSWVCGFKENRVFGLVDEVMKRLFPATKTTTTTSTGLTG